MTRRFRRGLIVGKFSPLHLGHMRVIDAAIAACEQVYILSYSKPELPRCSAVRREAWLRDLYPMAEILVLDDGGPVTLPHNEDGASDHRQFVGWVCEHMFGVQIDAVFTSEDYGDGFAAELGDYFFRRGRARTDPVTHVLIDQARHQIPTSGTAIRRDPHAQRAFLDPRVYASYVQRVAVLGGESSGKTTLCAALAERFQTAWVPEYGRERWNEKNGVLEYEDMLHIGQVQRAREDEYARRANRWLFCDTTPATTLYYSLDLFARASGELERLAEHEYDIVFLCVPDFPFVQDGTRRDPAFSFAQHKWHQDRLRENEILYTVLRGPLEARIEHASSILFTSISP